MKSEKKIQSKWNHFYKNILAPALYHFIFEEEETMTETDLIANEIKAQRIVLWNNLFEMKKIADLIDRGDGGREMALAITNLQQARMWLGEVLGARGHLLPPEYRDYH